MSGGGNKPTQGWNLDCKIYVGGLHEEANKYDLEDAFGKYGPVKNVWVARRPPGFGFVEMEGRQDAEEAVRMLDGAKIVGMRIKVQMSNGGKDKEEEDKRRDRSREKSHDHDGNRRRGKSSRSRTRSRSKERGKRSSSRPRGARN